MRVKFSHALTFVMAAVATAASLAKDKSQEQKWHCEKTDTAGNVEDIEADSKADCKKKGGLWAKAHDEKHTKDDGHKHD